MNYIEKSASKINDYWSYSITFIAELQNFYPSHDSFARRESWSDMFNLFNLTNSVSFGGPFNRTTCKNIFFQIGKCQWTKKPQCVLQMISLDVNNHIRKTDTLNRKYHFLEKMSLYSLEKLMDDHDIINIF